MLVGGQRLQDEGMRLKLDNIFCSSIFNFFASFSCILLLLTKVKFSSISLLKLSSLVSIRIIRPFFTVLQFLGL